ncbi:MBL fold metallo-hydrolase [Streptomyces sp. DSM 44917]|uniref:MBL fold metallo-hydrolase n=1 Tax=Streptomyces boetiae TaxID=3075541 RepID=A0ABU2L7D0_9ACTN|nr:MBL fold metallo-hydrolase [Streptomyces sp. DSM 44917]MDT0307471.1 MBL fold metallo-hydrolase [Streptomyces sp. DSM 44917]
MDTGAGRGRGGAGGAGREPREGWERWLPGEGWEAVAPGVFRRRLPGWDETVGLVASPGGLLLVDAGPSREAAGAWGAGLPPGGVTRLVVTHPHFDHLLGAGAFPAAEAWGPAGLAAFLAAPGAADPAADGARHGLHPAAAAADLAAARERPWRAPSPGRGSRAVLDLGGGRAAVLADLGPAHSALDLAVLVPGTPPVVFCGDLVEESGEPQAGPDASPERWPAALDALLALGGPEARYVPGHGAVVGAAFVRAQREELAGRFGVPPRPGP